MSCLCHKLETGQYLNITNSEGEILKRTWKEAPHLFQDNSPDTVRPVGRAKGRRLNEPDSSVPTRRQKRLKPHSDSSSSSLEPSQPNHTEQPHHPEHQTPQPQPHHSEHTRHPRHPEHQTLQPQPHHPEHQELQLRPDSQSSHAIPSLPLPSSSLTATYRTAGIFDGKPKEFQMQQISGSSSNFVRIFLAVERSDQNIEIQQLFRRICCYVAARLHAKHTSVDLIVREIENAVPAGGDIRQKVYNILRIGTKWLSIVEDFKSITGDPQQLTGLLCLFNSASTWERAPANDYQPALAHLSRSTDILVKAKQFTPFVDSVLEQVQSKRAFVDETYRFTSHSENQAGTMTAPQSRQSSAKVIKASLHTVSESEPAWKAPSLKAVSEAVPASSFHYSEDAGILLMLLSLFMPSKRIPLDLLSRGALPCKRWTAQGGIEGVDAIQADLAPELCSLLSDLERLGNAFFELERSSAVLRDGDQMYILEESVASRVHKGLSTEHLSFWKCQALIVAYRAIPWKYIDFAPNTKLFLPHLKHLLQIFQNCFETLRASTRADLAITLIEAARFPNMVWKRFSVSQAEVVACGIEDMFLRSCIAQAQCLLNRIAGDMGKAASSLDNVSYGTLSGTMDPKMHSTIGQAAIQRSLNCVQVDDPLVAMQLLIDWKPLDQDVSLMEITTLFRRDLLLGRILRFQGKFEDSFTYLQRSQKMAEQHKNLIFDEDLRDLVCDLADTLRELEDPVSAEHHLRTQIARQAETGAAFSGQSLLELSLAEALFAQRCYEEAKRLCLDIQLRSNLLKAEKLRLRITLAKIYHVEGDFGGALTVWSQAMESLRKFPLTNGHTTRIIVISICDTLSLFGQTTLVKESLKQLDNLDELAKPGGTLYWIAGLRHWFIYLQSRSVRSRI